MNKITDLYLLTALSNLHVGRGDSNYGIVDNEVQRDTVTDYPTVFASSLKGALREATRNHLGNVDEIFVFGSDVGDTRPDGTARAPKKLQQGNYVFHQAHLLSLPVRGESFPYYHAVTPELLRELYEQVELLLPKEKELQKTLKEYSKLGTLPTPAAAEAARVDEYDAGTFAGDQRKIVTALQKLGLLEDPVALFGSGDFRNLCERLPVLARNQLVRGISKNLFYEEVVPRRARFFFFVERPDDGQDRLEQTLKKLNHRIQLGANATIGYGVCTLRRVASSNSKNTDHASS